MPSFVSKFLVAGDGSLLTAPAADGSSGQVLQTNGSGQLSFGSVSGLIDLTANYSWTGSHDFSQATGIGTTSPAALLHVEKFSGGSSIPTLSSSTAAVFSNVAMTGSDAYITIISDTTGDSGVFFGDSGDEDPGAIVYSNLSNKFIFRTAAAERMVVDSTGVGINISTPEAYLHVVGPDGAGTTPTLDADTFVLFQNNATVNDHCRVSIISGASAQGSLYFGDAADENAGYITYDHSVSKMYLRTNGSGNDLTISIGKVGIGETSPATTLHVVGPDGAGVTPTIDADTVLLIENSVLAANHCNMALISGTTGESNLFFGDFTTEANGHIGYANLIDTMHFYTAATQRMVIDGSGNVGVGTTSPGAKLHVDESAYATPTTSSINGVVHAACSAIAINMGSSATGNNYSWIQSRHESVTTAMYDLALQPLGGSVGIGTTSPGAILHAAVSGTGDALKLERTDANGYLEIDFSSQWTNFNSELDIIFKTAGTEAMRIDQTNNRVGIGNSLPDSQLSVVANASTTAFDAGSDTYVIALGDDANIYGLGAAAANFYDGSLLAQFVTAGGYAAIFAGNVGINESTPATTLHIVGDNGVGTTPTLDADTVLLIENSGSAGSNAGMSILSGASGESRIYLGDTGDENAAAIYYDHSVGERIMSYTEAGFTSSITAMPDVVIRPQQLIADSTSPFGITVRNQHVLAAFDDSTDEIGYFTGVMPNEYAGDGFTVEIHWVAESATSGDVVWAVSFDRHANGGTDIDTDSFVSDNTGTSTTRSTSGQIRVTTIAFTDGADMDSIQPGDIFRMRITRDADSGSDTMTGDAQIMMVLIYNPKDYV